MVVSEYPRSGGTWLCYILSYSLNIPMTDLDQDRPVPGDPLRRALVSGRCDHRKFPRFERVAKTHQDIREAGKRDETSILLVRDGRDVMVSYFLYQKSISGEDSLVSTLKKIYRGESSLFLSFLIDNVRGWVSHTKKIWVSATAL
ncbi:hypothetical protein [Salinibacter ruber]|uniref:hypothetical protein n=1 Tax=Salinibacter ruber TaxID=146919 RepID=UPI003C6DC8F2